MKARKRDGFEPQLHFQSKNKAQEEAFELYQQNDITIFLGPAGSSKTFMAVYCALYDLLAKVKTRHVEKIYITRPIVESGEYLGWLPGNLDSKLSEYFVPIYDCLDKLVTKSDQFIKDYIKIAPLAYLRGRTFLSATALLDEAQNATVSQIKMFLSRLGIGSKIIITADPEQSDIGKNSGINYVVNRLEGEPGVGIYRFTEEHIVRHPLVGRVLKLLNK